MTAREFIDFALEGFDMEEALTALARYVGKSSDHFMSFPDSEVLDVDGNPLSENPDEPAGMRAGNSTWR